jgi:hypothetical protein
MAAGTLLAGLAALAIAVFSVFGRRAVDMWDKGRYREVASSVFLGLLPVAFWMLWLTNGDAALMQRNLILGLTGAAIGAAGFIWVGYVSHGIGAARAQDKNENPSAKDAVNITGNNNVVSLGQTGDITAGTYINQAPQPALKLVDQRDTINADGTHTTTFEIEVVSQLTPAFLAIDVSAQGIVGAQITPPPVGGVSTMMLRNVRRSSTNYHAELTSPRGRYAITVETAFQTPVKLDYQF